MHEIEKMDQRLTDRPHDMTPAAVPPRKRRQWHMLVLAILNLLGLAIGLLLLSFFVPVLSIMERTPFSVGYPALFLLGALAAWAGRPGPRVADDHITASNRTSLAVFATAMLMGGIYLGLLFRDEVSTKMVALFEQNPPIVDTW